MTTEQGEHGGSGPVRVLLVEDSAVLSRLVKHLLVERGYEVETAGDGRAAIDAAWAASRAGRGFDMILMDVVMPELNGCEAAYQLRQAGYAGRIVMLTAADRDYDLPRAFSAGADDYLSKPFTPTELGEAIRRNLASDAVNPLIGAAAAPPPDDATGGTASAA